MISLNVMTFGLLLVGFPLAVWSAHRLNAWLVAFF